MTEKGFHVLKNTASAYKNLFGLVVVGSDKSLQKDYEAEIIQLCIEQNIPYVKKAEFSQTIATKYAIAIAWRWLIHHPADKLIVLHDSLLPRYRGFAPLISSLINGEKEIGVTAIFGASEFDTGDIITQSKSTIQYPIKIAEAISIVNTNYVAAMTTILETIQNNDELKANPQKSEDCSYSVWRDELDYKIDWNQSSAYIRRFIDALGFPYKGAFTLWESQTVRIFDAEEVEDVKIELRHPGKLLFIKNNKPIIICGSGLLQINSASIEHKDGSEDLLPLKKFRLRFM